MSDILMLLKCSGLQYDDRVRKECESLKKEGYSTEVHVVEDKNGSGKGLIYSSETKYTKHALLLRKWLPGNKLLLLKLLELFFRIFPSSIKKRKYIWLHDPLMFVFVPYFALLRLFGRCEKIVWDQHELPPSFMLNVKPLRWFYVLAMKLADTRIHANESRAQYLNDKLGHDFSYKVLNNFVDEELSNEKAIPLSDDINKWLDGQEFVLLQSGAYRERHFDSVATALCTNGGVKCLVVGGGNIDSDAYRAKYSNFDDVFYFVGMVPQIRLVDYIDAAKLSVILYDDTSPNSLLCEPNRLYQATARGTRVLVGNNPPMKSFVEKYGCGSVLEDDGKNSDFIYPLLMEEMSSSHEKRKVDESSWSSQQNVFKNVF